MVEAHYQQRRMLMPSHISRLLGKDTGICQVGKA